MSPGGDTAKDEGLASFAPAAHSPTASLREGLRAERSGEQALPRSMLPVAAATVGRSAESGADSPSRRARRSESVVGRKPNRRHVAETSVRIDGTYVNLGSSRRMASSLQRGAAPLVLSRARLVPPDSRAAAKENDRTPGPGRLRASCATPKARRTRRYGSAATRSPSTTRRSSPTATRSSSRSPRRSARSSSASSTV